MLRQAPEGFEKLVGETTRRKLDVYVQPGKSEEIAYAGSACLGDISERLDSPRCDFFLDFYDLLD